MIYLLLGLLGGLAFCVPHLMDRMSSRGIHPNPLPTVLVGAIVGVLTAFVSYVQIPEFDGLLGGWGSYATVGVPMLFGLLFEAFMERLRSISGVFVVAALFIYPTLAFLASTGFFYADEYKEFVAQDLSEHKWEDDFAPIDTTHLRLVERTQAIWMANKALGQAEGALGSRYRVGQLEIQRVKGELVWVAPLEYQGFASWQSYGHTPGYVKVSAEDPKGEAKLVTGFKFKYLESAWFGEQLNRHLFNNGYATAGLTDYTLELDDESTPHFVVTVFDRSIGNSGEKVRGVVVVNPENGDLQFHALGSVPEWIDRVIPPRFAEQRLQWHGEYINGWWNSLWAKEGVMMPTNEGLYTDVWMTWGSDGKPYWFTGLSSPKKTDQSLVGFVMMDTRTGVTKKYTLSGMDEQGVLEVVNSAVSNFNGFYATQPILYNIWGTLTWVVPVVSSEGIFQRVALVTAGKGQVALGKTKKEALREYRKLLSEDGNNVAPAAHKDAIEVSGTIDRYGCATSDGNTTCYFTMQGDLGELGGTIFTVTPEVTPEAILLNRGDGITVKVNEAGEEVTAVVELKVQGLFTRISPKQSELNERIAVAKRDEAQAAKIRYARERFKNMTDQELLELDQKLRERGNGPGDPQWGGW